MKNVDNKFYVYIYSDPRDGVPFYVGKGKGKRSRVHLTISKQENHRYKNLPVCNKIRKLWREGVDPVIEKKFVDLSEEDAFEKETGLIAKIGRRKSVGGNGGPLMNLSDGGEGVSGYKVTDEMKKHLSENHKGEKNPMYGKKSSKKQKDAVRKANTGKVVSEETCKKLSRANSGKNHSCYGKFGPDHPRYGKKFSEESIEKLRTSLGTSKKARTYIVTSPDGEVFRIKNTLTNICRELDLKYRPMLHVLNNEQDNYMGWFVEPIY